MKAISEMENITEAERCIMNPGLPNIKGNLVMENIMAMEFYTMRTEV